MHVDAVFDGGDDGCGVALVGLVVGLAEIRADAEGRNDEALRFAEVTVAARPANFCGVLGGACQRVADVLM